MKLINLQEHNTVLNQYMKELRAVSIQGDPLRFRRNIERIGQIMAYEISRTLPYAPEQVTTPLGTAEVNTIATPIVLGTIFRAGLPMHQGFLSIFDRAENAFVSAYRKEDGEELEIVSEYLASPRLDGKTLIIADPMLATGMSMEIALRALIRSHGTPAAVHLACVIGCDQAVAYLQEHLPVDIDITLWAASIDPVLNEHHYIVPGLGDAGDLCFGEKL